MSSTFQVDIKGSATKVLSGQGISALVQRLPLFKEEADNGRYTFTESYIEERLLSVDLKTFLQSKSFIYHKNCYDKFLIKVNLTGSLTASVEKSVIPMKQIVLSPSSKRGIRQEHARYHWARICACFVGKKTNTTPGGLRKSSGNFEQLAEISICYTCSRIYS